MERINKKGFSLTFTIIGVTILVILVIPTTYWLLSMNKNANDERFKMAMSNIVNNQWQQILNEDYKEQGNRIKDLPKDTFGNHYEEASVTSEYSVRRTYKDIGTYTNGECKTGTKPSELETSCRVIDIEVKSLAGYVYKVSPTRIQLQAVDALPKGSIITYTGDLNKLPGNWHLCDGEDGTPNMKDLFVVGAGNQYALGDIGGTSSTYLSNEEAGTHYHYFGQNNYNNQGNLATSSRYVSGNNFKWHSGMLGLKGWNGRGHGSSNAPVNGRPVNLVTTLAYNTDNLPHENRPPFYAIYFIIKMS